MYWKYEVACKEANMSEVEIKEIRRIFDDPRKKLKKETRMSEEKQIVMVSIEADREGYDEILNIPDENCNVESDAIDNVNLEKLMALLAELPEDEKETILALYNPSISFEQYARDRGIPQSTLRRRAEKTFKELQKKMGVINK